MAIKQKAVPLYEPLYALRRRIAVLFSFRSENIEARFVLCFFVPRRLIETMILENFRKHRVTPNLVCSKSVKNKTNGTARCRILAIKTRNSREWTPLEGVSARRYYVGLGLADRRCGKLQGTASTTTTATSSRVAAFNAFRHYRHVIADNSFHGRTRQMHVTWRCP